MILNKNQKNKKNNKQLLILFMVAIFAYFIFNLGEAKIQGALSFCKSENKNIREKMEVLQEQSTEYQKNIETLQIKESILREKYDSLVASEDIFNLFSDVNKKIEAGIELSRIERAVNELRADRNCSKKEEKRFIVKTPLYKGDIKHTNVSFEKKLFDITADGYSFINKDKRPESWFDLSKPVFVSFNTKDGIEVIKQELPIQKSIILKDKEYFFEIIPANTRGFVKINEFNCNYP